LNKKILAHERTSLYPRNRWGGEKGSVGLSLKTDCHEGTGNRDGVKRGKSNSALKSRKNEPRAR